MSPPRPVRVACTGPSSPYRSEGLPWKGGKAGGHGSCLHFPEVPKQLKNDLRRRCMQLYAAHLIRCHSLASSSGFVESKPEQELLSVPSTPSI